MGVSSKNSNQNASPTAETEEVKYKRKCKELRKRLREVEESNDVLALRIDRNRRAIQRLFLERAFLLEKLELRTLLPAENAELTPSPPGSPTNASQVASLVKLSPAPSALPKSPEVETLLQIDFNDKKENSPLTATPTSSANASTSRSRKSQALRDPNAPKRPQNAYMIFCDLEKERVRSELEKNKPTSGHDLTRAMAESWRELADEGRQKYYKLYDQEKARYEREMADYVPPPGSAMVPASKLKREKRAASNAASAARRKQRLASLQHNMEEERDEKDFKDDFANDSQSDFNNENKNNNDKEEGNNELYENKEKNKNKKIKIKAPSKEFDINRDQEKVKEVYSPEKMDNSELEREASEDLSELSEPDEDEDENNNANNINSNNTHNNNHEAEEEDDEEDDEEDEEEGEEEAEDDLEEETGTKNKEKSVAQNNQDDESIHSDSPVSQSSDEEDNQDMDEDGDVDMVSDANPSSPSGSISRSPTPERPQMTGFMAVNRR